MDNETPLPLEPYRVLDLTEGGANFTGKLLADLGADVLRIEPPGGSPTRHRAPFFKGDGQHQQSLFFLAYNINKRGITLDITRPQGRELLLELARRSHVLLESFEPGYLDSLGLGYKDMEKVNPALVFTSMTPFGQSGPYAHFKASDIVVASMGGKPYLDGEPDLPPLRVYPPQVEVVGASMAAAGTMMALFHAAGTGEGQHVDVSQQEAVIWTEMCANAHAILQGASLNRRRDAQVVRGVRRRGIRPCKDGYVMATVGGFGAAGARTALGLVKWMAEEEFLPRDQLEPLFSKDWLRWSPREMTHLDDEAFRREIESIDVPVDRFLLTKTMAELLERAVKESMLIAPCYDISDIMEDVQLKARDFWVPLEHTELAVTLRHPGPFVKLSETPIRYQRPAPLVGEHNDEVYRQELQVPKRRLQELSKLSVI